FAFIGPYTFNSKTRVGDIADGTSNTIAFGETLFGTFPGPRDWSLTWMGSGTLASTYGLGVAPGACPPGVVNSGQFSSKHAGVVNFSFVDGSVHAISTSVNQNVFFALSGMNDGTVLDGSRLSF